MTNFVVFMSAFLSKLEFQLPNENSGGTHGPDGLLQNWPLMSPPAEKCCNGTQHFRVRPSVSASGGATAVIRVTLKRDPEQVRMFLCAMGLKV
jgi:hypothetical protein